MKSVDAQIGDRVYNLRRQCDVSQGDLGKAVGVSYQQIQKYESGRNRLSASTLFRIARCLDVPVSYFFAGIST